MKKLIPIVIILIAVFFFRKEITGYTQFIFVTEEEPFEWVASRGGDLYADLPEMSFEEGISSLSRFEEDIRQSLAELDREEETDTTHSYRRRLQCEMAVVYRQTALKYLEGGDDDNYMLYMAKTQEQIRICSVLREASP